MKNMNKMLKENKEDRTELLGFLIGITTLIPISFILGLFLTSPKVEENILKFSYKHQIPTKYYYIETKLREPTSKIRNKINEIYKFQEENIDTTFIRKYKTYIDSLKNLEY